MKKSLSFLFAFLTTFILVEIGIRLTGKLKTYSEANFDSYQSAYSSEHIKHLFVWEPNDTIVSRQTEFFYTYNTNEYGLLTNKSINWSDSTTKLVFLGDSFVFGVGAAQDSSLPVLLGKQLQLPIINAGIPGSDPFFEVNLVDSIFKPKGFEKYIVMLNFSDIYDFVIRGGNERFLANNKVAYRNAPWIEPYYQKSYLIRAFVHKILHMDYSLLQPKKMCEFKEDAIQEYTNLLLPFSEKFDCIVVLQPYARQYTNNNLVLSEVLNYTYLEKLDSSLRANNIKTINLNPSLKKFINSTNSLEYSWELDGHYNAKGYALLSKILADELTLNYPEFITQKEETYVIN